VKNAGFTLIELVVVMLIVAVLTAIAVPSYLAYTHTANRSDATRAMTQDAQALERCYSQTFTYVGCAVASGSSPQGYYALTVATSASSYTITATPNPGPQTSDSACQTFTLNNAGTQWSANGGGTNTTQTCWGST
jgi:type IV pilus assembly protein PilE